ncbi:hypothetical protein J4573_21885 [Actinomadura barringtoniae]|uniref:Uncharacterized protein n=1 Tax=Actinomadura barringtoniae TaxID=1427535 RepID=A0A939T7Y7_9ACTN|nr:hypothetical protein [Actinomadura barringtoniae]MBO2449767.1 hypothetical protein [Actinomadura barringtoniae]
MTMITEVRAIWPERTPVSWSKPLRDDIEAIGAEKFRDLVVSGMIPAVM